MKRMKKILSLMLVLTLMLCLMPASALADEGEAAAERTDTIEKSELTEEPEGAALPEPSGEPAPEEKTPSAEEPEAVTDGVEDPESEAEPVALDEAAEAEDYGIMPLSTTLSLAELQAKFPNGAYWNHYVSEAWQTGDNLFNNSDIQVRESFCDSVTWSKCASHSTSYTVGSYDCNVFDGGLQCCGFARKLGYDAYGSRVTSWYHDGPVSSIKAGDVLHYYGNGADASAGHWVFVTAVSGTTVTVGECNIGTDYCRIRWGHTYDMSQAYNVTVYSAPWDLSANTPAPSYEVDTRYPTPFKAYTVTTDQVKCYYSPSYNDATFPGWIDNYDECTIEEVYTHGWCKVTLAWPDDPTGYKTVYVETSYFLNSGDLIPATFNTEHTIYRRANLAETCGQKAEAYQTIYKVGQSGNTSQIIYMTSNGNYCGWLDHTISPPQSASLVSVTPGTSSSYTTFTWDASSEVGCAYIRIFKGELWSGEEYSINRVTEKTVSSILPEGSYKAYLETRDINDDTCYINWTGSCLSFTVEKGITYTIRYDANGGTGAPGSQIKNPTFTITLSRTEPIREGYTFLGWATSPTATDPEYLPGSEFNTDAETTLYAVWEKDAADLTGIKVAALPAKTVYEIGEELDTTGLSIEASYDDGTKETITSGFTVSGFDSSTVGSQTVTVSYGEQSTTFTVTVKAAVSETDPQIVVGSQKVQRGGTVSLDVSIANNPGFCALNIAFIYDNNYLTLTGIENKLPSMVMTTGTSVVWDATEDYTSDGAIATLTFEVAEDAPEGNYEIQVIFWDASNENFETVSMSGVSGVLQVISFVYGDANGDGQITTVDLAMLRKYLASKDPITGESTVAVQPGADCNGDGTVSTVDLAMLRKYLASKDPITGESSVVLGPKT